MIPEIHGDQRTEVMAKYIIGVDTGGTFTDVCVLDDTGKSPSARRDNSEEAGRWRPQRSRERRPGAWHQPQGVAEQCISYCQALPSAPRPDKPPGAKTGMITTKGFEDTSISRGRGQGGRPPSRRGQAPGSSQEPEPFIPKSLIIGVNERIDSFGKVVVPLDEEAVRKAARKLAAEGVRPSPSLSCGPSRTLLTRTALRRSSRRSRPAYSLIRRIRWPFHKGVRPLQLGDD